jgi:PIN domain nuclease of toxin-antitoxin system
VRLLLDSHIALWAVGDPTRLTRAAVEILEDGANEVFVSSASIWELRLKSSRGKLTLPPEFEKYLLETGFSELPVRWPHAVRAAELPPIHSDPFDRLLVAQSIIEGLVLVTRDDSILKYDAALLRG